MKQFAWIAWTVTGAGLAGLLAWAWTAMPDTVPSHFGVGGEADNWSSKGSFLTTMGLVGGGLHIGLPLLGWALARGSGTGLSVPHKEWWFADTGDDHRLREFRSRITAAMALFAAVTTLLMAETLFSTARAAGMENPNLGAEFWVTFVAYMFATIGWLMWLHRYLAPPKDERGP